MFIDFIDTNHKPYFIFRVGDSIWSVNYYKGKGLNWGLSSANILFDLLDKLGAITVFFTDEDSQ